MSGQYRMAHWLIRLPDGTEFGTDRLTLDECDRAEAISGTPYSLLNPGMRAKDAKALFLVAMLRSGAGEDAAVQKLQTLTLGDAIAAFTWVPAEKPDAADDGEQLPPSSGPTPVAG